MRSTARVDAGSSAPYLSGHATAPLSFPRGYSQAVPGFESNLLLEILLKHLGVGLVLCDGGGRITLVNEAARRLAQKDPEGELLRASPSIWGEMFDVNGRQVPAAEWPWARALHGTAASGTEYRLVRRDGHPCDVLFGAQPIRWPQSQAKGVLSFLTNITEPSRRNALLRNDAVLNERSRLAGEIHDTLVQGLYAVVLQLEAADKELSENLEQGRQRLRRLRELAKYNLSEARRSIWALSNESFGNEDPAVALEFLARRLFDGMPTKMQFDMQISRRGLAPEVRLEILRIGKEALVNVLRHARATLVRIELVYGNRRLRLSVRDNGRGFEPEALPVDRKGYGLFSSRMRAESIGGKFMIRSMLGKGTRMVAIIPLTSSKHTRPAQVHL